MLTYVSHLLLWKHTFTDVYHIRTEMMMPCHTYQALSSWIVQHMIRWQSWHTSISVPQQGLGKDHTVNTQWVRVTVQRVKRQPREERKHSDRCQEPKGSIYLCSANKRLYLASRQVSKHGCVGSHLQRNFNFCFSVISFSPSRSGDRPVRVWSVWCWEKPGNDTST